MNTVKKGDAFEKRVFEKLAALIELGDLGFSKECCKLYSKKEYFSRDRGDNIIVDVSVEVFLPGSTKPFLYLIVECKDYGKPIPVNEIEEFYDKTRQITGANVKALFATTSNLQSSAFNVATSRGIGVIRLFQNNDFDWLIYRTNKNLTTSASNVSYLRVMNALSNEAFVNTSQFSDFGMVDYKVFNVFECMVIAMCKAFIPR